MHAKSACCQAPVHRFGRRRRQCSRCKRTWRPRPRRRGRPRVRQDPGLLDLVLREHQSLRSLARQRYGITPQALGYRFRRLLHAATSVPRKHRYSPGALVLLTDGLWFRFQRQPWVLYLMAIKSCRQNRAIFLDPVLLQGREEVRHWRRVFRTISPALTRRIRAVVCDNLRGMKRLVRRQGWVLQLCHFHLISQLQARRGRRKPNLPGATMRELAYRLVRQALELPEGPRLFRVLQRLRRWPSQPCPSRRLRMVVREFLRERDSFRAYRLYPDLDLPATTNAVEAMGRLIRDLARHARNFRSPQALQHWAVAFVRRRPEITCNGKHSQPN
jgi:hypothetical protein